MSMLGFRLSLVATLIAGCALQALANEMPRLTKKDGRYALLVDGRPYLILGAQINNSSAWPGTLPEVWPEIEAMHANTMEAPIYWEQFEPRPGEFDFRNIDELVKQARAHEVYLV